MIDTHCHLTFPEFSDPAECLPGGVPAVLGRAAEHGVTGCITIATTTRDCVRALAIAKAHDRVWCSAGVHPCHSHEGPHDWDVVARCAADPKCVAWGELGLDNHHAEPPKQLQLEVLAEQLDFIERQAAAGVVKPIVLHCREAFAELVPILRRSRLDPTRMVFHCFTGSAADMRLLLDLGSYVSFTGVLTYKGAKEVREAAALAPLDRVMVETDAPFLSPDPHRTERPCQPWMVSLTARKLAEVHGARFEEFHQVLNDNTARFFGVR
ncbi:MAG: TatD family hydrolase [Phycisphaerales bacterium]